MIKADSSRLKQVVVNLIGNALKYTNKGSVKVSTAVKKGDFLITVADSGIGISSEEQANLFQKFYRVKNEQTRDIIGTGLGHALAQGTLVFTLGVDNTEADIDKVIQVIPGIVQTLRDMSPLYKKGHTG